MHRCVWFCFGAYTSVALGASPPPCGGGRVYFKVEAALTVGDQRITADQLQQPAIIEKVEGDRAWLAGGWLPISELIAMGEAEGYYNAEIKRDPSDATARYLRGLFYIEQRDDDKATRDLSSAIRLNPNLARAYLNRGELHRKARRFDEAATDLREAAELDERHVSVLSEVYVERGGTRQLRADYDGAEADFAEAIRLTPDSAKAYLARGGSRLQHRKPGEALLDLDKAVFLAPENDYAHSTRGSALAAMQRWEEAWVEYTTAIELHPSDRFAYRLRALVLHEMGRYDEAILDFNTHFIHKPRLPAEYVDRARTFLARGDLEEADKDLTIAIDAATTVRNAQQSYFDARWKRAWTRLQLNRPADSLQDFNEVVRLDSQNATTYWGRAHAHDAMGRGDEAIADYTEAIRISPDYLQAYQDRGVAWEQKQAYDRAIQDYAHTILIDPTYAEGYVHRGNACVLTGEFAAALKDFNQAIRLDPQCGRAHSSLGWLLATCPDDRVRNGKLALKSAAKSLELSDPTTFQPLASLAAAHAELGDFPKAVARQTQAIGLAPESRKAALTEPLKLYQIGKPYRVPSPQPTKE